MAAWPIASNGSIELPAVISVPLTKSRLVILFIDGPQSSDGTSL
jgi:hypothetical protein